MSCLPYPRLIAAAASLTFASGCGAPAAPPARNAPTPSVASAPPAVASAAPTIPSAPPLTSRPVELPTINHATLPNGLNVWHVGSRTIPTVHVRLVVRTGAERPAVARLAAIAVERARNAAPIPGAPKPAVTPLRADVSVRTAPAVAVFSLDLPRDQLEPGIDLLGAMVKQPRLDAVAIASLRAADAQQLQGTDPASLARDFATAELLGTAAPGADDASRVLPADLKAFHKTWYTPHAMGVVVAGDVTFDEAMEAARRAFGAWDAPAPQRPAAPAPAPAQYTRVVVIDRPGATQAAVVIAAPGAAPSDPASPAVWLMRDLISRATGASPCPSSAADVISARSSAGIAPILSCFQPTPDRISETVAKALERARTLSSSEPSESELQVARAAWNDQLATGLASIAAQADFAASAFAAGMDHDAPSRFVTQINAASAGDVREAARSRMARGALVVVTADASRVADELSRFGDVVVVDPEAGFARKRQIPANPQAAPPSP